MFQLRGKRADAHAPASLVLFVEQHMCDLSEIVYSVGVRGRDSSRSHSAREQVFLMRIPSSANPWRCLRLEIGKQEHRDKSN